MAGPRGRTEGDRYGLENGIRLQSDELAADIASLPTASPAGLRRHNLGRRSRRDAAEKVAFKVSLSDVQLRRPTRRTWAHHLLPQPPAAMPARPLQGAEAPLADLKVLREGPVDDDHLRHDRLASRLTVAHHQEHAMKLMSPIDALFLSAESREHPLHAHAPTVD